MLEGRVALVTGSSRGLGRGIAVALGRRGASVVVNYLSRDDEAAETVRRVIAAGGDAWPYRADVTDPVQMRALVDAVLQRHGRLDVLVYTLSFDALRSALSGRDAWILVLDAMGVNVWCAAAKGTFDTDELVRQVEAAGLRRLVARRGVGSSPLRRALPAHGRPPVSPASSGRPRAWNAGLPAQLPDGCETG